VVAALGLAGAGLYAFIVALRPSRVHFEAGEVVSYRLHSSVSELQNDGTEGPPSTQDRDIVLIGIDSDNDVVLLCGSPIQDEAELMNISANGSAFVLDAAMRPGEAGKALGLFDFNLLPLPLSTEQSWNVDLLYAALPSNKRLVQGRVKRLRSGADPEFQLKLPTSVEWIDQDGFYEQLRDMISTYRFNAARSLVDSAHLTCIKGLERADGRHRYSVRIDLTLQTISRSSDDPHEVRDLALAVCEAQSALEHGSTARFPSLATRMQAANVQDLRLRSLVRQLCDSMRNPVRPTPPSAPSLWAVKLGSCSADQRGAADAFVRSLARDGLRAWVSQAGDTLVVLVGPYYQQDPALLATLSQRYPRQLACWVPIRSGR
jgi:hypothetical protein